MQTDMATFLGVRRHVRDLVLADYKNAALVVSLEVISAAEHLCNYVTVCGFPLIPGSCRYVGY